MAVPLIIKRIINRIGRPAGINPFPRAFAYVEKDSDRKSAFEQIYQQNLWGSEQSKSGDGSELEYTAEYRKNLISLLKDRKFTSMLDAPCGDLNWMLKVIEEVEIQYQGGDISSSLIAELQSRYPALHLTNFDICKDNFPKVDVWHCRDCLFHLPFADIQIALQNFVQSDVPFALLTTHKSFLMHQNLDIPVGGFRFLDLEKTPFYLPKPLHHVTDYKRGSDFPRYVGLWSREMIQQALAKQADLSQDFSIAA